MPAMPKVAIVSYGMSDMAIPLIKHLAERNEHLELSLFLVYAQNKKKEGIVNFHSVKVNNGFVPDNRLEEILGAEILDYVGGRFKIAIFVYHNLRFRSFRNLLLSLRLAIRLRGFGLIHINGVDGTLLQLLPFLEFKNWITTVHDFNPHSGEDHHSSARLERFLLSRAKRIVIQNLADYSNIETHYPGLFRKTVFIPFGYLDIYKAFLPRHAATETRCDILFFGRISKYKGLEYFLDALEILEEKGLNPEVIIGGSGSYDFGIDRIKNTDNIRYINKYIDNSELAQLIHQAKVVVCPYLDATQSGVLMTAFAFGKPVVATSVGSFKDVISNGVNGLLVSPKAAAPLAAALETLLRHPEMQNEMSRNIQNYVKLDHYDWGCITGKLLSLYEGLTGKIKMQPGTLTSAKAP